MNIGFIGAGKVGCAYGRYLSEHGLSVYGYFSKSKSSADLAAEFTKSLSLNLDSLVKNCDFIFITTPDDVISNIWTSLKSYNLQDKKIFHMSGSISSKVFDGIETFGANGYSLHPIYPFTDKNSYKGLSSAVFTIEGKNIYKIEDFLSTTKIKYFEIPSESKEKYHAAAVFASNYLVVLAKIAKNLLLDCGIPNDEAINALLPLMEGSLNNIRLKGAEEALTGPILRGDKGTVNKHLRSLSAYKDCYISLAKVALDISRDRGNLNMEKYDDILKILNDENS